jgi:hypothetical protein
LSSNGHTRQPSGSLGNYVVEDEVRGARDFSIDRSLLKSLGQTDSRSPKRRGTIRSSTGSENGEEIQFRCARFSNSSFSNNLKSATFGKIS